MKKIIVFADHHYIRRKSNHVFVPSVYSYDYWKRYLSVFGSIVVCGRGNDNDDIDISKYLRADGEGVSFHIIKDYSGMAEFIKSYSTVSRQIRNAIQSCDCAIIRVPSPISTMCINEAIKQKKVFAVEICADPAKNYDGYPCSKIIKAIMQRNCQKACIKANGVLYVTKEYLQRQYPSSAQLNGEDDKHFDTYASNVVISEDYYKSVKRYHDEKKPIMLIHVANKIDGASKGHYVCLDIVELLKKKGYDVSLTFVGEGPEVPNLMEQAKKKNIVENVLFTGLIRNQADLISLYLKNDFMLLPSKTEGLPRCIIEAMTLGIVCLASNVGGIPELLQKSELFYWDDAQGFCNRIIELANKTEVLNKISDTNIKIAKEYSAEVLQSRREDFYRKLKGLISK